VIIALQGTAMAATTAPYDGANWQMNETSGRMLDSSGNHNNSTKIMPGITRDGASYHFVGTGSVIVKSSPSLQPGTRPFSISAAIHLDSWGHGQNFFQKGGLSETRGQYKIEISGKHVHCRIAGTKGVASLWLWGKYSVLHSPGFHTVTCTRTADSVTLTLGRSSVTQKVDVGSVTTPRNVTIGGKGWGCGDDCDYLHGNIDWARLTYL
jgi:hypothetical protein